METVTPATSALYPASVQALRLEPGAQMSNYRADNEQLVFAAEGELEVMLEGKRVDVAPQDRVDVIQALSGG